uniref:Uncharacterized protein n=1 Tax=Rhipicephalus microplus TaxID=6941 RepID=A0A6M2D8W5_RHIMP
MFAHVHVVNQTVHSLVSDMSLRTFEATCASYTQTTCGLSFSIWMLKNDTFSDLVVQDTLKDLQKRNNINHLGILDLQGTREEIDMAGVTIVPAVLAAMRHHLGHNSEENKIVLGLGYYYYDHPEAWSQLSRTGLSLSAKDVDVLVVISTVVSIPSQSSCMTLPSNALMSEDRHAPNMEGASIMARDTFGRSSVIVAFALQMGVITYTMTDTHDRANDALYKNCTGFGITDYSQACQVSGEELGTAKTMISINNNASVSLFNRTINRTMFQTFDTTAQMKDKAKVIMNKPERRANFSWFLFNVELTDVTGHCLPEGPFDRLKQFKEFYLNEARNGPPT